MLDSCVKSCFSSFTLCLSDVSSASLQTLYCKPAADDESKVPTHNFYTFSFNPGPHVSFFFAETPLIHLTLCLEPPAKKPPKKQLQFSAELMSRKAFHTAAGRWPKVRSDNWSRGCQREPSLRYECPL